MVEGRAKLATRSDAFKRSRNPREKVPPQNDAIQTVAANEKIFGSRLGRQRWPRSSGPAVPALAEVGMRADLPLLGVTWGNCAANPGFLGAFPTTAR